MFKLKREKITKNLTIEGLHCGGCAKRVENAFLKNKSKNGLCAECAQAVFSGKNYFCAFYNSLTTK